jgi:DNA-binding XRE family transcriptional regulator
VKGNRVTVKKEFLEVLREKCSVYHAAKVVDVSRKTVYKWRHEDPEFAESWNAAIEDSVDKVESSLYERALAGDTTATIFFLKGNRAKYRDRVTIDVNKLDADIERELAALTTGGETPLTGESESEAVN